LHQAELLLGHLTSRSKDTTSEFPNTPALPQWFDIPVYVALSETARANSQSPMELSLALLDATDAATPPETGWVVNSSTGKDSTVLTALVCHWLLRRRDQGTPLREVMIAISDTRSEFPEMASRMRAEREAINEWATRENLPLTCVVVQPPVKNRLLVEVIGNGKPLPKISNGKSQSGLSAASWCMDRVKATPLDFVVQQSAGRFPSFVQMLGVRSAESAKRAITIDAHAGGLPFGVTTLDGRKANRIGLTPIVHWTGLQITFWFKTEAAPWNLKSNRNLREIYAKGSGDADAPTECSLTITKEGEVSNSCSDLSGTRMGCWMCMLSVNKSLKNTADKDPRYAWLAKFHSYLYGHHRKNEIRRNLRAQDGFKVENLFPKSYTFHERYVMLMMLFRAELESGFTLLEPEELEAIRELWKKIGVWNVDPEEARADALAWKTSGKIRLSYLIEEGPAHRLGKIFGEGIPAGAFWQPHGEFVQGLEKVHLAALAGSGYGSSLTPTLSSYVLADLRDSDRLIVMVTDTPSVIGTRTNTCLLSGLIGAAWTCVGIRAPTEWEKNLALGRSFFYVTSISEDAARARHWETEKPLLHDCATPEYDLREQQKIDTVERVYQNRNALIGWDDIDPLTQVYHYHAGVRKLAGQVTAQSIEETFRLCQRLAWTSDILNEEFGRRLKPLRQAVRHNLDFVEGESPTIKKVQQRLRKIAAECLHTTDLLSLFLDYTQDCRRLATKIKAGHASPDLIERLAYMGRMEPIDPEDVAENFAVIRKLLGLTDTPGNDDLSTSLISATENFTTASPF